MSYEHRPPSIVIGVSIIMMTTTTALFAQPVASISCGNTNGDINTDITVPVVMTVDSGSAAIDGITLNFSGSSSGLDLVDFAIGSGLPGWVEIDEFDSSDGIVSVGSFSGGVTGTVNIGSLTVRSDTANVYAVTLTGGSGAETSILAGTTVGTPTTDDGTVTLGTTCPPVSITDQPTPGEQSVCPGADVSYSVSADGTNVTYQWRLNGSDLAGETGPTLDLTGVSESDDGTYIVLVDDDCGTPVLSDAAVLNVNDSAQIVEQPGPLSQSACLGSEVSYSANAAGSGLTYQWIKDGNDLSGETGDRLTLSDLEMSDAGVYSYRVEDNCGGSVTSETVELFVVDPEPPVIDIQPIPASQTVCAGTSMMYEVAATGTELTYQWQVDGNDLAGPQSNQLVIDPVEVADEGTYRVLVTDACGQTVTSDEVELLVYAPVEITGQPAPSAQAVCPGSTADYSVTAAGIDLVYQWQFNGTDITGETSDSLTITDAQFADSGTYTVLVEDSCGFAAVSDPVTLDVQDDASPVIASQPAPQMQEVCTGETVTYSVSANGLDLTYQWLKDGIEISGATQSELELADIQLSDAGNYSVVVDSACGDPVTSDTATLQVTDETLMITGQPGPASQTFCPGVDVEYTVAAMGADLTYQWQKNGTDIDGETTATLSLTDASMNDTGSYSVVVSDLCGDSQTSDSVSLEILDDTINITSQPGPAMQDVCASDDVVYVVETDGDDLSYQWQLDDTDLPGATDPELAINTVLPNQAGNYRAVITHACGNSTSTDEVTLDVTIPPAVNAGTDFSMQVGDSVPFGGNPTVNGIEGSYTVEWTLIQNPGDAASLTDADTEMPEITASAPGTYEAKVTAFFGPCTVSDTVVVTATPSVEQCPNDPNKTEPGVCGCGVEDVDSDDDGVLDCEDMCPNDPNKIEPGVCGCGVEDADADNDGTLNCRDNCPTDPNKIEQGICGCGVEEIDSDQDGVFDCEDGCPNDPDKIEPGVCGCGVEDVDSDEDGAPDCVDNCPNTTSAGQLDFDNDGIGNVCDPDADGDGFEGPLNPTDGEGPDCDDGDASINPDAEEICDNGRDDDCDGAIDGDDEDCDATAPRDDDDQGDDADNGSEDADDEQPTCGPMCGAGVGLAAPLAGLAFFLLKMPYRRYRRVHSSARTSPAGREKR
jgi:hypothetical protein